MVSELLMPKMGATMNKGTIVSWFKNEGDRVEEGEPILEIMSDKINIEVESPVSGILLKKLYLEDEEVPVLKPIAYIGDSIDEVPKQMPQAPEVQAELVTTKEGETTKQLRNSTIEGDNQTKEFVTFKIRRTPLARRLAKEYNIDLREIKGSGPNNRVHKYDIELYLKNRKKITPLAEKISAQNYISLDSVNGTDVHNQIEKADLSSINTQVVPYKGLRKAVGDNIEKSWKEIPHVTLNSEILMDNAINLRKQLLPIIEKQTGYRLSFSEILIKAVAHTLKRHPMLNATLVGDKIKIFSSINIGFAVSVPNGLFVPVIKNADQKGLVQLTEEAKRLTQMVRSNNIDPDQMTSGTFTISNLGMYAVNSFTPIINTGQAAILGVGKIEEKVVKKGDSFDSVSVMTVSLSFDHRIVDGAPAAEFLTDLKRVIENPFELLI
jgi:pyruvate dehydrogenase E2 component (dihydrolipoamide acetyltransferase)